MDGVDAVLIFQPINPPPGIIAQLDLGLALSLLDLRFVLGPIAPFPRQLVDPMKPIPAPIITELAFACAHGR